MPVLMMIVGIFAHKKVKEKSNMQQSRNKIKMKQYLNKIIPIAKQIPIKVMNIQAS